MPEFIFGTSSHFSSLYGASGLPAGQESLGTPVAGHSDFQGILARLEAEQAGQPAESAVSGVAEYGLLGWADEQSRRQSEVQALKTVIQEQGLTTDDVEAMSHNDQAVLEGEVLRRTEAKMVQAVKETELNKIEDKKSVLYRHTPLPPEKDTLPGI